MTISFQERLTAGAARGIITTITIIMIMMMLPGMVVPMRSLPKTLPACPSSEAGRFVMACFMKIMKPTRQGVAFREGLTTQAAGGP